MSADIQRNTPVFWPCRTRRSQMSSIISGVTRQKFTKFLHDIATSSPLLARTFRQWYYNSFLNSSVKNASGISRRSWHFPKINWLPWQRPSTNWKTRYRYIICSQSAFIWWKVYKNRSTISWDIWLNMPDFCDITFHFGLTEQSMQGVGNFAPFLPLNWFAMVTYLKISKNVERSDHLQFNIYHMVQRL